MANTHPMGNLVKLSDSTLTVADSAQDVRGRKVLDKNGDDIGEVDDLLLDDQESHVRFLQVAHGGFLGIGESHVLVPVDAVERVDLENVHIDRGRGDMTNVPGYDPKLTQTPDYYTGVYGWWGYGPYWAPDYAYPMFPRNTH